MKALILKDTYVIWRQMKYFLVMILLFSALPSGFNNAFAVGYAAMLPYTALAYDERSKWEQMAAVMPYSTRDIVLGYYVFGWLCIAAAAVLSLLLQAVLSLVSSRSFSPAMMAMFLIIFLVCGTAGAIASIAVSGDGAKFSFQGPALVILLIAAVVLTAASVPLSQRFYRQRMG